MNEIIYPRSPREMMAGWIHLPRFIDKIRLHLAGHLAEEYRENFTHGFDGAWLEAAGISADQFIEVVRTSLTDGQVCDWVRKHATQSEEVKGKYNQLILNRGKDGAEHVARLKMRKEQSGLSHRDDIQCMVDYIDADEHRM